MRTASSSSSKRMTDQHGPEDLLLGDGHRVVDVGEQRRLDEVALGHVLGYAAAGDEAGALRLALLDVAEHPLLLALGDLRPLQYRGVGRVAVLVLLDRGLTISTASS